ncbi:RDD family protein [Brevibacillus dissolubilis]|uniref:RDD family protein n=1 Tax=Brevibacillus dissolubilis TaxID=1844116 RepID=UPI001C3F221E|nr:RDD family protein [Brevibacillus dissolubilis]
MNCSRCGTGANPDASYCIVCGNNLAAQRDQEAHEKAVQRRAEEEAEKMRQEAARAGAAEALAEAARQQQVATFHEALSTEPQQQELYPAPDQPAPAAESSGYVITENSSYAGFWVRVSAVLIDSVVLMIPNYMANQVSTSFSWLFLLVGPWLYCAYMESSSWQGTVGKRVFALIVTDGAGNRLTFGKASLRYWSKALSGLTLCIGFMMAGMREKKEAMHDLIAGTYVIKP